MKVLCLTPEESAPASTGEGESAPEMKAIYKGNPLLHIEAFQPGDALKATVPGLGLEMDSPYPILGYWNSAKYGMHVYLGPTPNAMLKHYRYAVEEGCTVEEVLFYQLPEQITEICLMDYRHGLAYVPAYETEVVMKRSYGGKHEQSNVIPLHDKKGQYLLFNIA